MRRRGGDDFWQSYADLAMGLMAVFALVLIMLLWLQSKTTEALQQEKQRTQDELELVKDERLELEQERREFAMELLELIDSTYAIVRGQDAAESWLRQLFEERDCLLALSHNGSLQLGSGEAAGLYEPGAFRLSREGQEALESCRRNFIRLAYCLSPDSGSEAGDRAVACAGDGSEALSAAEADAVAQLRRGIEALVLEGNTDRIPMHSMQIPRIRTTGGVLALPSLPRNFVSNAYLGAERARQALGHLLGLVRDLDADSRDALPVLMSRVRIESPSFARYLVGPQEWREPGCSDESDCEAARNLALRIRWKKGELRRPYQQIRARICDLLADPDSAFVRGLVSAGRDVDTQRERFDCTVIEVEP